MRENRSLAAPPHPDDGDRLARNFGQPHVAASQRWDVCRERLVQFQAQKIVRSCHRAKDNFHAICHSVKDNFADGTPVESLLLTDEDGRSNINNDTKSI